MRIGVDPGGIRVASDAAAAYLAPPAAADVAMCPYCRTWLPDVLEAGENATNAGGPRPAECENCVEVREALDMTPLTLSMLSLYSKPSTLRDILTRYKGREDEDDPLDPACVDVVRALLGRFVLEHGARLEEKAGSIDAIVVVPSTERSPPHPLEAIVESLEVDAPLLRLLGRGDGDMGFRKPDRNGFRTIIRHPHARLLLIDDVYTTGARLNSAAVALHDAGHTVAAAFVVARRINPGYSDEAARLWAEANSVGFDWRTSPWI